MDSGAPSSYQVVLIVDDDEMITAGLSAALTRSGRTIITCNDVESAELVVESLDPSHVVSDIRLSGPFSYEGLDFIRFVKRQAPDTRVILMTGEAPEALQLEASERGAVGFLRKPFEAAELDAMIDLLAPLRAARPDGPELVHVPLLDQILPGDKLSAAFQPIIDLESGRALGFEALTRFRTESMLRNPELLFKYATRKLRVLDLELACLRSSLRAGAELGKIRPLFINVHPAAFAAGDRLLTALKEHSRAAGLAPDRVVLEITEQGSLGNRSQVLDSIQRLKDEGVAFAFDDVGVAYSHLTFIDAVRPSYLKISQHFGTNFESDGPKTKLVRNLLSLARDFECELILEGIESEATARAAADLGIKFGQGYHFGRPAPAEHFNATGGN